MFKGQYLPQQLEQGDNDVFLTSGSKQTHTIVNTSKVDTKTQDDVPVFDKTISSSFKFKETHQLKLPENSFQITSKFVNITAVTRYNQYLFLIDLFIILWVFKTLYLSILNNIYN